MNFSFLSNLGSGASAGGLASFLGNNAGNIGGGDFSDIAGGLLGKGVSNLFDKLGPDNKFNQWRGGITNNLNELYGLYNQQPQDEEEEEKPQLRPYAQIYNNYNDNNNNGFQMRNYAKLLGYR
jgi:hypothetical protein